MEAAKNILNWLTTDGHTDYIQQLSKNQVLNIANDINTIFDSIKINNKKNISLPRIVVVGTQSSGKSSVLNAIITMDILPTGKNMVTRTPLNLHLTKIGDEGNSWVEFGHYKNNWVIDKKISITAPSPTPEEVEEIRITIANKTIELAGPGMNISDKPITLKIFSPYVPNLSLTDLPGLTMLAQTDLGQPITIKNDIEKLVLKYINKPNTIVLTIMQARVDLETDLGLALVKKNETTHHNTQQFLGVLTKPDLMNYKEHVGKYLEGSISKNLMLTHGYYVVRNRSNSEAKEMTIREGFTMESDYFKNHPTYKQEKYNKNTGIANLTQNLSEILIDSIKKLMPSVMNEILLLERHVNNELTILGQGVPDSQHDKLSILNKYISDFNQEFIDSIESKSTTQNTGKQIKDSFNKYKILINTNNPFSNKTIYNKSYFDNVLSSFEGNHMSFHVSPVKILEACMTDTTHNPIMTLHQPSLECVTDTATILTDAIKTILKRKKYTKYNLLSNHIIKIINDNIISKTTTLAKQRITNLLKDEESYVWTDNPEFLNILKKSNNKNMDLILNKYFSSIKHVISHSVPKIIMNNMVRNIERSLLSTLIKNILNTNSSTNLLQEDSKIETQRIYYNDIRNKITSIKNSM